MGNAADNVFWGMDGNDKLKGGGGRDSLYGGNGESLLQVTNDSLTRCGADATADVQPATALQSATSMSNRPETRAQPRSAASGELPSSIADGPCGWRYRNTLDRPVIGFSDNSFTRLSGHGTAIYKLVWALLPGRGLFDQPFVSKEIACSEEPRSALA